MATFKIGDEVVSGGHKATVVGKEEMIAVRWHYNDVVGNWPARYFEFAPRFQPGDFVRLRKEGLTGYIFEDDGSMFMPFNVALNDEMGNEEYFDADDLELWTPRVGDRVVDVEDDDGLVGTVTEVFNGTTTATVLWDTFTKPQHWQFEDLEPADYEEPPPTELQAGDTVGYTSPFFAEPHQGKVMRREGNIAYVEFGNDFMTNGYYPVDSLTKKAV